MCNAGTSKNNDEDLKTAKRLKTAPFKISDTKVCKIPIISYSHSCSHSSDKYIASPFIYRHFRPRPLAARPRCVRTLGSTSARAAETTATSAGGCSSSASASPSATPAISQDKSGAGKAKRENIRKKIAQFFNTFSILHLVT